MRIVAVARHILGDKPIIDLDDDYTIEFGDGYKMIAVTVRNGKMEVRSPFGATILIEPMASNSILVAAIPPNMP